VRIVVFAAAALGLVLLWGCWLVYCAGIGSQICVNDPTAELNPTLLKWCSGNSWQGWLGASLAIAAAMFAASVGLALRQAQAVWLIPGTLLPAIAVWAGFAVPQEAVGAVAPQPKPSAVPPQQYQQQSGAPTTTGPSLLKRAAPSVLPSPRRRGLAQDIIPAGLFGCPRKHGRIEFASGPGAVTNFDAVLVERGPRSLCASFTSPEIATFADHQEPTEVMSLTFKPRNSSHSLTTPNPRTLSVEVWASNQGSTYSLVLRPSVGAVQGVSVGNLGIARGHLSILIDEPRLPAWILNGHSRWSAHLT
jgi:hypothetical protein